MILTRWLKHFKWIYPLSTSQPTLNMRFVFFRYYFHCTSVQICFYIVSKYTPSSWFWSSVLKLANAAFGLRILFSFQSSRFRSASLQPHIWRSRDLTHITYIQPRTFINAFTCLMQSCLLFQTQNNFGPTWPLRYQIEVQTWTNSIVVRWLFASVLDNAFRDGHKRMSTNRTRSAAIGKQSMKYNCPIKVYYSVWSKAFGCFLKLTKADANNNSLIQFGDATWLFFARIWLIELWYILSW